MNEEKSRAENSFCRVRVGRSEQGGGTPIGIPCEQRPLEHSENGALKQDLWGQEAHSAA